MDYEKFFKLKQRPFKVPLEAKFFYRGKVFANLCQILSASELPPLVILKGLEGAGKSTIIKRLPLTLRETTRMAPILNPTFKLSDILSETLNFFGLGFKCPPSAQEESLLGFFQNACSNFIESSLAVVLAFDDAHLLSSETLTDLLALTKLEKSWEGRTSLILVAPQESDFPPEPLKSQALEVLLPALEIPEVLDYVRHRMRAAGANRDYFTAEALVALHQYSQGLPSKIDPLAERALMTAWAANRHQVTVSHVAQAKATLDNPMTINTDAASAAAGSGREHHRIRKRTWVPLVATVMIVAVVAFLFWPHSPLPETQAQSQDAPDEIVTQEVVTVTPAASPALPQEGNMALPSPPPGLLHLPHNTLALVVDHSQNMARLWQGSLRGVGLKAEIAVPDFKDEGLYLVGRPRSRIPLIFQYPPAKEIPKAAGEKLWQQVESLLPQDVLPLMVGQSPSLMKGVTAGLDKLLLDQISSWTQAQEYKLADKMAQLYAETFDFYEPGHKPMTISRKNFRAAFDSEVRAAGDVQVAVSEPLIMLDPRDKSRAWAVFNLKYDSKLRHDTGLRTLIFEKSLLHNQWLIVAELWIKEDTLKP
jgi:type II secretory pathway predicted ATPase ExeA